MNALKGVIWIITGPREVGKTRFCIHLISEARKRNIDIAGVICPPRYYGGSKIAIDIEDTRTGEHFTLAKSRTNKETGITTDHWIFDPEILRWGNQILASATPCEILIVDELGPLEFSRGEGWQEGLKAVDSQNYRIAVVVIRPELVKTALSRWPTSKTIEIPSSMGKSLESSFRAQILDNATT